MTDITWSCCCVYVPHVQSVVWFGETVREAKWHCSSYPVAWAGRPDLSRCVSDAVLDIHGMVGYSSVSCLILWCQVAHCCHMDTAIKNTVPDWV